MAHSTHVQLKPVARVTQMTIMRAARTRFAPPMRLRRLNRSRTVPT
jgi:hypothetical protein